MSSPDLNFHIGDKVVYPNHGVGIIEQISSRSSGASIERFYLLHIKASSLKVMVPCQNAGSVGLRRVVCRNRRRLCLTWGWLLTGFGLAFLGLMVPYVLGVGVPPPPEGPDLIQRILGPLLFTVPLLVPSLTKSRTGGMIRLILPGMRCCFI